MKRIRELIDYLAYAKTQLVSNAVTAEQCEEDYWKKHCALALKKEFRTKSAAERSDEKVRKIRSQIHLKLWKDFQQAPLGIPQLELLRDMIRDFAVILDSDIFVGNAPEKTGFHGESRIVRFLFIRDYPAIHLAKTGSFFYLGHGERLSGEAKEKAREFFRDDIKSHRVAMGSSQGTCADCGDCLDEFGIKHGAIGNVPNQWLDPLTMCGRQGGTTINKPGSLHAIFVAFRSIIAAD